MKLMAADPWSISWTGQPGMLQLAQESWQADMLCCSVDQDATTWMWHYTLAKTELLCPVNAGA